MVQAQHDSLIGPGRIAKWLGVGIGISVVTVPLSMTVGKLVGDRWTRMNISVIDRSGAAVGNAAEGFGHTMVNTGPKQVVEGRDPMRLPRWARVPSNAVVIPRSTEAFGLPFRWFVMRSEGFLGPYVIGPPDAVGLALDTGLWSALAYCIARRFTLHFRRGQERRGLCSSCSYSLVGNTTGICPECGEAISSSPPSAG
jgi:hypothetical protein